MCYDPFSMLLCVVVWLSLLAIMVLLGNVSISLCMMAPLVLVSVQFNVSSSFVGVTGTPNVALTVRMTGTVHSMICALPAYNM